MVEIALCVASHGHDSLLVNIQCLHCNVTATFQVIYEAAYRLMLGSATSAASEMPIRISVCRDTVI